MLSVPARTVLKNRCVDYNHFFIISNCIRDFRHAMDVFVADNRIVANENGLLRGRFLSLSTNYSL